VAPEEKPVAILGSGDDLILSERGKRGEKPPAMLSRLKESQDC